MDCKVVEDMWNKGYDAIRKINVVLEDNAIDTEDKLELDEFRTDLHLYLSILYGDVPLQLNKELGDSTKSSRTEIFDFAKQEYSKIISAVSGNTIYKSDVYINTILVSRLQDNFTEVYKLTQQALASGEIALAADGRNSDLNAIRIYLLAAEAAGELNKTQEALQYINILLDAEGLPLLSPTSTVVEQQVVIRDFYKTKRYDGFACDYGMKYNNIISWSLNSNWAKHKLFPIPSTAISKSDGKLSQNAGY